MSNALFRLNNEGRRASRDLCHGGVRNVFLFTPQPSPNFDASQPLVGLTAARQYVRTIVDDFSGKQSLSFPFPVRFLRARVIMHATTAYRLHATSWWPSCSTHRVLEKYLEVSVLRGD